TAEYVRRVSAGEDATIDRETLSLLDRAGETIMLQLRLNEGINAAAFEKRFAISLDRLYGPMIEQQCSLGLLSFNSGCLRLTSTGQLVANQVLAEFLSPSVPA